MPFNFQIHFPILEAILCACARHVKRIWSHARCMEYPFISSRSVIHFDRKVNIKQIFMNDVKNDVPIALFGLYFSEFFL